MTNKITNCIWFDHNADEAVKFYTSIFKNSEILESMNNATDTPSGKQGSLLTVSFQLEDVKFLALNGSSKLELTPSISLMVFCDTKDEVSDLWTKLSEGETHILMPLDKYEFSDYYGWLADKFGLTWQIILRENPSGQKIIPCLLFVDKLFGRAEEAINFYTSVFPESQIGGISRYDDMKPGSGKEIAYAGIELEGQWFSIMDGPGDHKFTFNQAFSFIVFCDTQEEIDQYWANLSADPSFEMCGWLKDKFGVAWQIVPSNFSRIFKQSDPARSKRAMEKMMTMKKLNIAELETA